MAEVRVRLPLGALNSRTWESLVFRVLRAHEIAGSNPAILTFLIRCQIAVIDLPVKQGTEVRPLPPELLDTEGQANR